MPRQSEGEKCHQCPPPSDRDLQWRRPRLAWTLGAILLLAPAVSLLPRGDIWIRSLGGLTLLCLACVLWLTAVLITAGRQATPQLKWVLCLVALAGALSLEGWGGWRVARFMDQENHYRRLSAVLRPELERVALDATALIAPEPEAMEFYSYRRALSWASLGEDWNRFEGLADGRHARVFLARPSATGLEARALDWLSIHKLELTPETPSRGGPEVRVFVDAAPRLPPLGPERPPGLPEKKAIIHPPLPERRYRRL